MTWWLYPLSYSSFTLFHSMNWGPDRFLRDFWWLLLTTDFREKSLLHHYLPPPPPRSHWGQGPKYPLGTWWKHWDHSQHVTQICPAIKYWVHFEYTLLCDPDMPSGYMLSTFWMCPAIWLQCTQWANNWAHFQYSQKSDSNMPSG